MNRINSGQKMLNAQVAAWILTILFVIGCITGIVKAARKSNSAICGAIIVNVIQIYLYYCVGIFALL